MAHIQHNTSLLTYNTFGIDVKTSALAICHSLNEILDVLENETIANRPLLILGGGSNLVFTKDFAGTVLHPKLMGIEKVEEDETYVWIEAGAGVLWDDLVGYAVSHGWGGIENLSYIPGCVGASPIQNIGAYGTEVKDTIEQVKGLFLEEGKPFLLTNKECDFDYRNSIFKNDLKNKTLVTSVVYRLTKQPEFNLDYGSVHEEVTKMGQLSLANVRKAITAIRKSKLPEPSELGNAGSFFKNPIVTLEQLNSLKALHADAPFYPIDEKTVKIPAGWLIEQSGWKGKTIGRVGVHANQALVLINKGGATGEEVFHLANLIINDIKQQFSISLEPEVNMI